MARAKKEDLKGKAPVESVEDNEPATVQVHVEAFVRHRDSVSVFHLLHHNLNAIMYTYLQRNVATTTPLHDAHGSRPARRVF